MFETNIFLKGNLFWCKNKYYGETNVKMMHNQQTHEIMFEFQLAKKSTKNVLICKAYE